MRHHPLTFRVAAWILVPGQILLSVPQVASAAPPPAREKAPELPKVKVNRTLPAMKPPALVPQFSAIPTDDEIFRARVFDEPLVPIGGATSASDNRALADALLAYLNAGQAEDVAPLTSYLEAHPASPWRVALLTDLGIVFRRTAYFSRALDAWEEAWGAGKSASDPRGRAIADRALGELVELNGRLGRFDRLQALFSEADRRVVRGSAAEKLAGARSGYEFMETRPEDAFRCGPMAIDRILAYGNPAYRRDKRIVESRSTSKGTSLVQMRELAGELGLRMQVAKRDKAAPVLVPALVHWKAGHFAALVAEKGGRYLIQDPTFGDELWVTREALDTEGSGYFLVREGALSDGWQPVGVEEAATVWGKGLTTLFEPEETSCNSEKAKSSSCQDGKCGGMADYNFHSLLVSLNIMDTPVGYRPPVGPSVDFTLTYNQRDAFQPQIFSYSNLGHQWTFDWLSYIEDNPSNLTQSVTVYRRGGGRETYSGFDSGSQSYAPHMKSRAVVVRTSVSPIRYERRLPDGSVEVFAQSDGAASPRRVFMTDWRSPQWSAPSGSTDPNAVRYYYEGTQWGPRLVNVKDGIDQVTTLSYENSSDPLKITKVTDPFGRFATLEYNVAGQLERITDVIGIQSSFVYGPGDFVKALTTPYGTTQFRFGQVGTQRWLEAEDPLGAVERVEFRHDAPGIAGSEQAVPAGVTVANAWLEFRNSFYWDKRAMALYPGNYSKARLTHFLHTTDVNVASGVVESTKAPLERRVWYTYPNQNQGPQYIGSQAQPSAIARVLDDGTTQVYRYEYNSKGKVTKITDPVGRETVYIYGTNNSPDADPATGTGIDLLTVKQKNGGGYDLIWSGSYDAQHMLLTSTDASSQETSYSYNAQGQILTVTTPARNGISENRTTAYAYDSNGLLQSVTGPVTGAMFSYTYDGYGRIRTMTDPDGYAAVNEYDALDRLTKVTYPDGTFDETKYNRLDAAEHRDRQGRWTHTFHDALRHVVAVRDPEGRTTTMEWCSCGSLEKIVDGSNNATTWERDLQGRVIREIRADNAATVFAYENTTSRLKQATDAKGQVSQLTYFVDSKLQQVTYANAAVATPSVSFTYDAVYNRLATIADGTGTTTYSYNAIIVPPALGAGRLAAVDGPLINDTVTYTYDELGRGVSRSVNEVTLSQSYDGLGRISGETNALGTFAFGYDGATGRVASASYPNGQSTAFGYFDNGGDRRLREVHNRLPGAATLSLFGYTYGPTSNIAAWTQQADTSPGKTFEFGYNGADEILTATLMTQEPNPTVLKRYRYAYDTAGNRNTEQIDESVVGGTYNSRNQLTGLQPGGALRFAGSISEPATVTVGGKSAPVASDNTFLQAAPVPSGTSTVAVVAADPSGNTRTNTYQVSQTGASRGLTYDLNGNLTGDGVRTYEWDAVNRLVAINQSTRRSEFTYDGLSRRVRAIEKENAAVITDRRYVWCDAAICEERDAAGSAVIRRFFTLGVQDAGVSYFYAKDHLGSIRELTDSAGVIRARYDYDPYGRTTKLMGDKDSFFGFSGLVLHGSSGLALARYRAYDAGIGRWLSPDPIGFSDGTTLYAYVHANPIGLSDPEGLYAGSLILTGLGVLGGIAVSPAVAAGVIVGAVIVAGVVVYVVVTDDDPITQTQASGDGSGSGPGSGTSAGTGTSSGPGTQTGPGEPPKPPSPPRPSPSCSPDDRCKGLRDQLRAHEKKLQDYLADPQSQDNLGLLGHGRDEQVKAGRIRNLQKQIENFRRLLAECERNNG